MLTEINATGFCSGCKDDFALSNLRHLSETESYLRGFGPSKPEAARSNLDLNILLCPSCYKKRSGKMISKNIL